MRIHFQALSVAQVAVDAVLYGSLAVSLAAQNTAFGLASTALKGMGGRLHEPQGWIVDA